MQESNLRPIVMLMSTPNRFTTKLNRHDKKVVGNWPYGVCFTGSLQFPVHLISFHLFNVLGFTAFR